MTSPFNYRSISEVPSDIILTEVTDHYGNTPLHSYVLQNNVSFMRSLLENDKSNKNILKNVNKQNHNGNTILHLSKSSEMTKLLLEHGCNPMIPNNSGTVPFLKKDIKDIVIKKYKLFIK
jgi:ankyrin repeat protein